ncbi:hypothetical protein PLANPX_3670 [Lacipirellula parvula]|uniref:Uncharacterized protein n=1 Tax=Lacipirellula parvula TaxID=2650471 RepID=A0A5K7XC22_9BACT|nr:hypothetical protein PLANPX_3670 [Lacipirellula parvula]
MRKWKGEGGQRLFHFPLSTFAFHLWRCPAARCAAATNTRRGYVTATQVYVI